MREDAARWFRAETTRAVRNVSARPANLLNDTTRLADEYDAAMERCLAIKPRKLEWIDGRKPTREELHDPAGFR